MPPPTYIAEGASDQTKSLKDHLTHYTCVVLTYKGYGP